MVAQQPRRRHLMSDSCERDDLATTIYPPWREALKTFLASGFKPGDLVEKEWLFSAFGLPMPAPDTPCEKADAMRLQFLDQMNEFRKALLTEHQIDLTTKPGVGYEVTPPEKQSERAYEDGVSDIRRGMRKMLQRVTNVNYMMLTAEQRKENADTIAKASMLVTAIKTARRQLPAPKEEE
jgi:hypothetical protein